MSLTVERSSSLDRRHFYIGGDWVDPVGDRFHELVSPSRSTADCPQLFFAYTRASSKT